MNFNKIVVPDDKPKTTMDTMPWSLSALDRIVFDISNKAVDVSKQQIYTRLGRKNLQNYPLFQQHLVKLNQMPTSLSSFSQIVKPILLLSRWDQCNQSLYYFFKRNILSQFYQLFCCIISILHYSNILLHTNFLNL